jgi:hypothetical protein
LLARNAELREKVRQRQLGVGDAAVETDLARARKAADESHAALVRALRRASQAHYNAARTHLVAAARAEARGDYEIAERHRRSAAADEVAAQEDAAAAQAADTQRPRRSPSPGGPPAQRARKRDPGVE